MMYEALLTEEQLAASANLSMDWVRRCRDQELICPVRCLEDGALMYRPNVVSTLHFIADAYAGGLDTTEIRDVVTAIELIGGGRDFLDCVIEAKIERLRERQIELIRQQRQLFWFECLLRDGHVTPESVATRPASSGGNTLM